MEIYELKHDISSLIFKIEMAFEILGSTDLKNSKEALEIGKSSLEKLKSVLNKIFLLDKLRNQPDKFPKNRISAGKYESVIELKADMYINDTVFYEVLKTLKELCVGKEATFDNGVLSIYLKSNLSSKIELFFLHFIIEALKLYQIDTEVYVNGKKESLDS